MQKSQAVLVVCLVAGPGSLLDYAQGIIHTTFKLRLKKVIGNPLSVCCQTEVLRIAHTKLESMSENSILVHRYRSSLHIELVVLNVILAIRRAIISPQAQNY